MGVSIPPSDCQWTANMTDPGCSNICTCFTVATSISWPIMIHNLSLSIVMHLKKNSYLYYNDLSNYLSFTIYVSINLFLSICLIIYLSISPSVDLSIYRSMHLPPYLPTYQPISLSVSVAMQRGMRLYITWPTCSKTSLLPMMSERHQTASASFLKWIQGAKYRFDYALEIQHPAICFQLVSS